MGSALGRVTDEGRTLLTEVTRFDALERERAEQLLLPCCPSRRWAREVSAGRPYGSMRQLLSAADDVLADLSTDDVAQCRAVLAQPAVADPALARDQLRTTVRRNLVTTLR